MSRQINLFNPVFLKQKKVFAAVAMARALLVLLVGLGVFVAYLQSQLSELERSHRANASQLTLRQANLKEATAQYAPRKSDPELEAELAQAEAQLTSMKLISTVLDKGQFGNTRGFGAYFTALARQNLTGLWLIGVDIEDAGNAVSLRGRAMSAELVPAYIGKLSQEAIMKGKSFGSLKINLPGEAEPPPPSQANATPFAALLGGAGGLMPRTPALAVNQPAAPAEAEKPYVEFTLYARPVEEGGK